jgi:hypothetical protein
MAPRRRAGIMSLGVMITLGFIQSILTTIRFPYLPTSKTETTSDRQASASVLGGDAELWGGGIHDANKPLLILPVGPMKVSKDVPSEITWFYWLTTNDVLYFVDCNTSHRLEQRQFKRSSRIAELHQCCSKITTLLSTSITCGSVLSTRIVSL